jgi:putative transposase
MPNQITRWKSQLLEVAVDVFGGEAKTDPAAATVDLKTLHAKIGVLTLKDDFRRGAHQGGTAERKAMIDPEHHLPIKRQAEVLGIRPTRSTSTACQNQWQPKSKNKNLD